MEGNNILEMYFLSKNTRFFLNNRDDIIQSINYKSMKNVFVIKFKSSKLNLFKCLLNYNDLKNF